MYALVADIPRYGEFLPWCHSSNVQPESDRTVRATIEIVRGRVRKSFTTQNVMVPVESIAMHLLDGPFKSLEGRWRFEQLGDVGCKVSLDMEFEFSNALMKALVGPAFNEIANSLVDAFCKRATEVYGT
jgi:ribosome-associated toxin RatA of RatAB toxin-antitoxin module